VPQGFVSREVRRRDRSASEAPIGWMRLAGLPANIFLWHEHFQSFVCWCLGWSKPRDILFIDASASLRGQRIKFFLRDMDVR
jgi:hypothetical protein